jgi:hypothetical protein
VGIGERVRAVHLSQFCAGGLGFPAGSPGSGLAGTDSPSPGSAARVQRAGRHGPGGRSRAESDGHEAQAAGQHCARCGREIGAGQPARRRADQDWVHADCR